MSPPVIPSKDAKPNRYSYVHCVECGLLVRLVMLDVPKEAPPGEFYGGECPNCHVRCALTFAPPDPKRILEVVGSLPKKS